MDSDDICKLFHCYNFDDDKEFQSGLEKLFKISCQETPERLLHAKMFYFSKKFDKKVTVKDYNNWIDNTNNVGDKKVLKDKEGTEATNINTSIQTNDPRIQKCVSTDQTGFNISESPNDNKIKGTNIQKQCEEKEIKTVLSDREVREGPSFGQVVEMISKGIPLPGVTDLGIKPLDSEPTITRMERKAKPWEQG